MTSTEEHRLAHVRGEDATRKRFGVCSPNSLYARCVAALALSAAEMKAENYILDSIEEFVDDVRSAVSGYADTKPDPNFWVHADRPLDIAKAGKAPEIIRADLERVVDNYLKLPVRSTVVDRTLVDILIAAELYAFAQEVYGGWHPISRIRVAPRLLGLFVRGRLALGILLCVALVIWGVWTGSAPTQDVWTFALAYFAADTCLAVCLLPFGWRGLRRQNALTQQLLDKMEGVYLDMKSDGPISARRVLERVRNAADAGVGWPSPLFALLDDIIAREGRF